MASDNKYQAQKRIDQIGAFQSELQELAANTDFRLSDEQNEIINEYHRPLVQKLAGQFDIDRDSSDKSLSLGMQIASFIGAMAMAASVFFLFYQFWGLLNTPVQLASLLAAPILTCVATFAIRRYESTGYFSKLMALVSFACLVLNITMLGQIFNIAPSPNALIVFAVYALILAYACEIRLLVAAGILCVFAFIAAQIGTWCGMYWIYFGEQPENFLLPTLAMFWIPSFFSQKKFHGFTTIYHVFSMIGFFLAILILSNWGEGSYLDWNSNVIEGIYQVAGFGLSALAVWYGITTAQNHIVATGNTFFVLFLYTKFFDWWWEWMPKSIFFFLIGLISILALVIFQRLRKFRFQEQMA